jgi:glutaredoxin-related protein
MKNWTFFILILVLILSSFGNVFAKEVLEINFFYSEACPHCADEQEFLDQIEEKYPGVRINRHPISQAHCREELIDLCRKYDLEKYIGLVPLTFIGEDFFLGFDDPETIGKQIEASIQRQLRGASPIQDEDKKKLKLPIIGEIDISNYSLFLQAVILGFFDGFNICSLGALILILGLVLILRSRSRILIFGGIFILITAIIYGLLIVLWYQLFHFLAAYLRIMEVLIGLLGIGGGIYFLKQFIKFKKYGPTCEIEKGGIMSKFSSKIQKSFKESRGILAIIASIFIFAIVITIVEFPCSAVIPVFFASTLAEAQLPALTYLLYIAIFILFYMLDEIIIFLIAFFTMTIKIASSKIMVWITLIEAIVLFGLGFYYLFGF